MFIEFADFPTGNWNDMRIVIEILLTVFKLQKIERRHGRIHMERDPFFRARLEVDKSGKLFRIAKKVSRP